MACLFLTALGFVTEERKVSWRTMKEPASCKRDPGRGRKRETQEQSDTKEHREPAETASTSIFASCQQRFSGVVVEGSLQLECLPGAGLLLQDWEQATGRA